MEHLEAKLEVLAEVYALDYIGKRHEPEFSQTKQIFKDGFRKAMELILHSD